MAQKSKAKAATAPKAVDENEGFSKITLTAAESKPLRLSIRGLGKWVLHIGKEITLPNDAVELLEQTDGIKFTTAEG